MIKNITKLLFKDKKFHSYASYNIFATFSQKFGAYYRRIKRINNAETSFAQDYGSTVSAP